MSTGLDVPWYVHQWESGTWAAGAWCCTTLDAPPGESEGRFIVCDQMTGNTALHVAAMHNRSIGYAE